MKIVVVHNSYQQPGGEDVVLDLERRLLESAGHQVVVYQRSNHEIGNGPAIRWPAIAANTIWSRDTARDFTRLLAREKPDVVHVHNVFVRISPSIYSVCQRAQVPVVQTLHNYRFLCPASNFFRDGKVCQQCTEHSLWRAVRYGCYRNSRPATAAVALTLAVHRMAHTLEDNVNLYIAPTEFTRKKFIEAGFPAEKIVVKPNFVDPDPSPGGSCSGVRESSGHGEYALFVGRLSPAERIRTMLRAWQHCGPRIPLEIVGGGPERSQLEEDARKMGLTSVRFQGHLSRAGTLAAIKAARFLIFPSEWYETFGMGIVEAFACSVPVIASRLGAMEEIVNHGRTGLHFSAGDSQDLAAKVEWAWEHPKEMDAMGRAARSEYESKYTAARNYPILMGIYDRAIATRSRANAAVRVAQDLNIQSTRASAGIDS